MKNILGFLFVTSVLFFVAWIIIDTSFKPLYQLSFLLDRNVVAKAHLYNVVCDEGGCSKSYEFKVDERRFVGSYDYDKYKAVYKSDSLIIYYWPTDPRINAIEQDMNAGFVKWIHHMRHAIHSRIHFSDVEAI